MSEIRYGIQYENYSDTLISGFSTLMQMNHLVDTTIMCNTHTLRVHKVVLAAGSPYFQEIFKNHSGELLIILKMDFIVLKSLVEFMYSGKTSVFESNLDELVSAGRFLKIKGLSEIKEEFAQLPEFSPPLVFNQPYSGTAESHQMVESGRSLLDNGIQSNLACPENPKNVVVRIPIEIKTHSSNTNGMEGQRSRNKYKEHFYDCYHDVFPKKANRRRPHFNKQDHKPDNVLGTRLLNKATRKVLRKEEKSSLHTIQQIKSLHGQQIEEPTEHLDLSEAVDNILDPILYSDCEEFVINNDEEHTGENIEISEQQFNDENPPWEMDNSPDVENNNMNSTISEYVDVLKSTGLPTDVPILFELEDGSYVNISGEVLLNMVQSNSVQYEVVEHTQDTEQLLQCGITKSIDQISEEIGAVGDISLEQSGDLKLEQYGDNNLEQSGDIGLDQSGDISLEQSGDLKLEQYGDNNLEQSGDIGLDQSGDIGLDHVGDIGLDHSADIMECLEQNEIGHINKMEDCTDSQTSLTSLLDNFND